MRFRKSIKIAPGIKINIGKKSTGISVGNKYGGFSVNSKTGARSRVSAPGTGLSYSTKLGSTSTKKTSASASEKGYVVKKKKIASRGTYKFSYIFSLIAGILCLIIGIPTVAVGGVLFILFALLFFYMFNQWRKIYNNYDAFLQKSQTDLPSAINEGMVIYPEQNLRIIKDCTNIINSTANPDTFFERYDLMVTKIDELIAIQGPKYTGQSPLELKEQVISKKQAAIHDMIGRYFNDVSAKASTLKTDKGKSNRFQAFISSLEDYYDQMEESTIKYAKDLYNSAIAEINEQ